MKNKRSDSQWQIISEHVEVAGKTMLDLGCGYADLLFSCWSAGAAFACGLDKDRSVIEAAFAKFQVGDTSNVRLAVANIEQLSKWETEDIIICFSVLPYLANPDKVLAWIKDHSRLALIECQYAGDGPGPENIRDDYQMWAWLAAAGWSKIEPIGKTLVEGREKYRTIWRCE